YGPSRSGRAGYFDRAITALRRGLPQDAFDDEFRTPIDFTTAAEAIVRLAETNTSGLIHVGGPERLSRFDLLCRAARALELDPLLVRANHQRDVALSEVRPADVSLDSSRLRRLLPELEIRSVEDALRA